MRALQRPPPPPQEPPSQSDEFLRNNAQPTNSSRGRRDAPATESKDHVSRQGRFNQNNFGYPDIMYDGQYSSDESESPIPAGKNNCGDQNSRISREPPTNSDVDGWRKHTSRSSTQPASSVQKQDPPDEAAKSCGIDNQRAVNNRIIRSYDRYGDHGQNWVDRKTTNHDASGKSTRAGSNSSPRDYLSSNLSASKVLHSKRIFAKDYPLLDHEEDLYEKYQDEMFHKQPLVQQQTISSQYGQFNIAPLIEMSPFHGKKSKKQMHGQYSNKQQRLDDYKWQSKPSTGRYSHRDHDENKDVVEQDIDGLLDEISDAGKHRKAHEELYNRNDEQEYETDDDSDDYDEERPLRRSSSSSSLHIRRSTAPNVLSRTEKCLNHTLALVIGLLSLVFIRDHTPWWKRYQSRVAMEKYENEMTVDPMKVYNTNDDDSTHARDHDPLNLYNEVTAGKRISDRPAEKSLHHGFMDENYENRPAGTNSGLATAKKAGVKDKNKDQDQETAAFLASVTHSSGTSKRASTASEIEKSKSTEANTRPKKIIPPPPPETKNRTDNSLASSPLNNLDSEGYSYNNGASTSTSMVGVDWYNSEEAKQEDIMSTSSASFATYHTPNTVGEETMVTFYNSGNSESTSMFERHDYLGDSSGETGDVSPKTDDQHANVNTVSYENTRGPGVNEVTSLNGADPKPQVSANSFGSGSSGIVSKSVSSGKGSSHETTSRVEGGTYSEIIDLEELYLDQSAKIKSQSHGPRPEAHSSTIESSSAFDQSMTTQDVKSVYKDSFYRWNHPFRHDGTEEMNGGIDVPVFWRIPRAASGVMEATMSYCYGLALASALGAGFEDETLRKIKVPAGAVFVNVDVSTPAGIARAAEMNLGSSRVADVISSPFIYETTSIFQGISESGKCFTLLRHPVDRAVSQYHFYHKEESSTNPNTAQYQGMTIDEYADAVAENNWMVRFLTNKRAGALSWHDLEAAKEVFGRKCLVGLVDKAEESIRRYERFFHWDKRISDLSQKENCLKNTLSKHDKRQEHPTYDGSEAWELLRKKNEYDVLLYEYAENLYSQQSILYENFG
ncbi:hypothetical protein HJC23_008509 [Cyclotella cryptica]|uniref:Sulfotransferase domain-containing protein n=1 Tax=Cyclotella cryptica TaxID=29204 RepID=A0ABD3QWS8_9STRA|eukprot:CCRYP_001267-RA/>CCRYP_001267-RA protein AED:0.26 eAED:0.26 QI:253/1/1/1/0.8/0.66/6/864/1063